MTQTLYISWAIVTVSVCTVQILLWTLFRRQVVGLCFGSDVDRSILRFYTPRRLRLISIVHPLLLIGTYITLSYYLW